MNTTPTNIANAIQAAQQQLNLPKKKTPAQMMSAVVSAEGTKKLLETVLKENAGTFTASVIDLYNSDKTLQSCEPGKVFAECLKAASLKLPINKNLGFAYVIPYKDKRSGEILPQFQIGYKGLIQLCMRTGFYKFINSGEVYEGEFKKIDKLTGEVDLSGDKLSEEIIGYFAYMKTLDGFEKTYYWTKDQVINHAKKYSKSYKSGSDIWKDAFDEMCIKTVLRNLLSHWGVMSVEMISAFEAEEMQSKGINDEACIVMDVKSETVNNFEAEPEAV